MNHEREEANVQEDDVGVALHSQYIAYLSDQGIQTMKINSLSTISKGVVEPAEAKPHQVNKWGQLQTLKCNFKQKKFTQKITES